MSAGDMDKVQSLPSTASVVVHVEDDPLWAQAIAKVIGEIDGLKYGGLASTADDAAALCASLKPAVVLLDLRLPRGGGMELVTVLARLNPRPRILFLTVRHDDFVLYQLSRPPVLGMIWKNTFVRTSLPTALERVLRGARYLPPEIQLAERTFRSRPDAFPKILSDRELDLLPLLGRGDTDEEISQRIGIKPSTVKSHREHILAKLNLHSSEKLIRWATEHGFLDIP